MANAVEARVTAHVETAYALSVSDAVWKAMDKLKEAKLTDRLGIAPGPANGFSLDIILCMERFGPLMDWAMIILNPLEPWPGSLCLPAAQKHDVKIITRVVDYGGLFHDDVKPGHKFGYGDHRTFRCNNCGGVLRDASSVKEWPGLGPAWKCEYCGAVVAAKAELAKVGLPRDVVVLVDRSCSMR